MTPSEDRPRDEDATELETGHPHRDGAAAEARTQHPAGDAAETLAPTDAHAGAAADHPERIGHYTLIEALGEGGMGTVWLAEQQEPVRREVALKVIKLGMDTREVITRFEGERQALAMMNHDGIARVLDAGTTAQGSPYFVMEHVAGEPITAYCDRHLLTVRQRLQLFALVCEAVQHAHQKGIIHRDLKPTNVLVSDQDGRAAPKIIDFGLAKAMDHRLTEATMFTQHGAIMGTPAYMSPEQVDPLTADIDTRADIYSLGVMLYELLVGSLPFSMQEFREAGMAGMQEMIRSQEPPGLVKRLSTLGDSALETAARRHVEPGVLSSQLRGDLEWVVGKAMDKDRERRYASASELAEDIERHLSDEPVLARPASTAYRLGKFVRRRRGLVVATAAVLVVLLGGLVTSTAMYVRAEERRAEAERDRLLAEQINDFFNFEVLTKAGSMGSLRELFDHLSEAIDGQFPDRPVSAARAYGAIGGYYEQQRELALAAANYRAGLALTDTGSGCHASFSSGCSDWAMWAHGALGKVLSRAGDLADARAMQELAVEEYGQHPDLGPDHPATLQRAGELAATLGRQEDLAGARLLEEKILATLLRTQGAEAPDTLRAMGNLANTLDDQGEYDAALVLRRELVPAVREMLGPDHPQTLAQLQNMAISLKRSGNLDEARAIEEEVLAARRTALGAEDARTRGVMRNLATTVQMQGEFAAAMALRRQVVELTRSASGAEHPNTLTAMAAAAWTLREGERLEEAATLQRQLVELSIRVLGADDAVTLSRTADLGEILRRRGDLRLAQEVLEAAARELERVSGAEHKMTTDARWSLAQTLRAAGDEAAAAALIERLCWLADRDDSSLPANQRTIRAAVSVECATAPRLP